MRDPTERRDSCPPGRAVRRRSQVAEFRGPGRQVEQAERRGRGKRRPVGQGQRRRRDVTDHPVADPRPARIGAEDGLQFSLEQFRLAESGVDRGCQQPDRVRQAEVVRGQGAQRLPQVRPERIILLKVIVQRPEPGPVFGAGQILGPGPEPVKPGVGEILLWLQPKTGHLRVALCIGAEGPARFTTSLTQRMPGDTVPALNLIRRDLPARPARPAGRNLHIVCISCPRPRHERVVIPGIRAAIASVRAGIERTRRFGGTRCRDCSPGWLPAAAVRMRGHIRSVAAASRQASCGQRTRAASQVRQSR
jgi:hypothetical protein